jgi:putative transcriptional regulator
MSSASSHIPHSPPKRSARLSLKGHVLIATPSITDPHFQGSVVLMIEDGPQGSIGLTLNKPSPLSCDVVMKELSLSWQAPQPNLLIGGPVYPETLWLLHSGRAGQADMQIAEGLALSRSREGLAAVCAADERDARLYFGCAGWRSQQLLGELSRGDWWVGEVSPRLVFGLRYDEVWQEALRSLGVDPLAFVGDASPLSH